VRLTAALDDVLATRGHVRVLRALDALPEGLGVSARDIARRAEVAHNRASEVLSALTDIGLTRVQRAGRSDLYQLNRLHVLNRALHELFRHEAAVEVELRKFLRRRLSKLNVREAYIFGSVARGESRADSDIDLAVVIDEPGPTVGERAELDELAADVRERFGGRLGVHLGTKPLAARVRGRVGRDLWRRIAEEGIRLLPSRDSRG